MFGVANILLRKAGICLGNKPYFEEAQNDAKTEILILRNCGKRLDENPYFKEL